MTSMNDFYDLIIIGAGPAGLSAGIYAGRAKLRTLIIDGQEPGGQIRITSEVVNYPGIIKTSGAAMSETMKQQAKNFGVSFLSADVTRVDLTSDVKEVTTSANDVFRAVSVLIATGARPRTLGFEGEEEFTGHGVAYCATCDGEFFTGMDVFVIGAGFAAAEEAIFLTRFAKKVTVIAREPAFTCSKTIADKVLKNEQIKVCFHTELLSLTGAETPKRARFINNQTKEEWVYELADTDSAFGVFVFVGYEPISELFKGQSRMDEYGYILTDDDMRTNIEGVYAAGDIRPKRLRQLVTAVNDGAVAATDIERYVDEKKERLGITIASPTVEAPAAETSEPFIDSDIKERLAPILDQFERPVELVLITAEDNALSNEMRQFARDFSELSDKVSFRQYTQQENDAVEKAHAMRPYPVLAIFRHDGSFSGITYHGVPGGHEFNSFVLALYNTAGPGQQTEPPIMERINKIQKVVNIKVCVSLSCTMCPDMVAATQYMAAHNPYVSAQMLDLARFPELKARYNIMSVPAMIINDEKVFFGKKELSQVLDILST